MSPPTEEIILYKLESDYPNNGFETKLGRIVPFYGRDHSYVIVAGCDWLTPAAARQAAAALVTVADMLERQHKP
jgi:hypothetical protein